MRGLLGCLIGLALLAPASAEAKACSAPDYPGSGYFTSLKVKKVGCDKGKSVARSHYSCRTKNGVKGRCSGKVEGYSCSEERGASTPVEFNANVTCKKGKKRVKFTYQQNT